MTSRLRSHILFETAYALGRYLLKERDLARLLQGICDHLTECGLYTAVFLVLRDQDSGGVITAESGMGERFSPIMAELREGRLPRCGELADRAEGGEVIACPACDCGLCLPSDCPASSALTVPVRCSESLAGFFLLHLPPATPVEAEELRICSDLADSVAQGLRLLFAEEACRERERDLRRVEERYELALGASQAGLWDWNIRTGEMYTSPDHWELLDYRDGDENPAGPARCIHPDDRARVLAVLNEHLTGETEEYRIEYRVQEESGEWTWFLDRGRVVERDENGMPVRMTGTHQNISLQKKQDQAIALVQQQLHEAVNYERNFLQTVIDSAGDPVMVIDLDFNLLLINKAAARLVQSKGDVASMQGQKCHRLFCASESPCRDLRFPCPVARVRSEPRQVKLIHNPYHGNRVNNTFELEVSPLKDGQGHLYGIIEVARDITDRLRIEKELRDSQSHFYRLAHHDALTGLPNRLLFMDRFNQAVTKAGRNRTRVAILFLDLDRFKAINDSLGHDVGDGLLVEVAARLQCQCRQSDTVARLGGDEFVFVLENVRSRKDASVVATKVMASLSSPMEIKGCELSITTSIGIALYPDDADTQEGVIKCADLALYAAKEIGRSNFQFYRQDIGSNGRRPQMDEQAFQQALAGDEFLVRFVPQFALAGRTLISCAAQFDWQHPQMGRLPLEAFAAAADECGLLAGLIERYLDLVCAALAGWCRITDNSLPAVLAIGLRQLAEPEFLTLVHRVLDRHGVEPNQLLVQFSEQSLVDATSHELQQLARLHRLGVGLAAEGIGGVQGSIPRLQQLPLDRLVLHRPLVAALSRDQRTEILAAALIDLGHAFGRRVMAEGIELEGQLRVLERIGCDLIQGPLLSPPLSADGIESLLRPGKIDR